MKPYRSLFKESAKTDYTKFFNLFKRTQDLYIGSQVKSMGGEIVSEVDAFNMQDIVTVKAYLDSVGIQYRINKINPKIIQIVWSSESNMGSNIVSSSEIGKIVNISRLKWKLVGEFLPEESKSACPRGWRIPTIHELHSLAIAQQNDGNYYNKINFYPSDSHIAFLSSSVNTAEESWIYDFRSIEAFPNRGYGSKMLACVKG